MRRQAREGRRGFGRLPTLGAGRAALAAALLFAGLARAGEAANLVANGSFEREGRTPGTPEAWAAAGSRSVAQALLLDTRLGGGKCAKLVVSAFAGDTPDAHAMVCQAGVVAVKAGRWYRLSFLAKGENIRTGAVEVALSDMRRWENAGLAGAFPVTARWEPHEVRFRARADVPAAASRLQFWFKTTGTLWLDDVVLTESDVGEEWFPVLASEGSGNLVPNSSFECGAAGWGSYTYGLKGWGGNLYRLEGAIDASAARHGGHSLKIAPAPGTRPVFFFDYYEPVRQAVRRILAANRGWFRVSEGETLTLSAFMRGDGEDTAAELAVVFAPDVRRSRAVKVGAEWRRHEFTFTAERPYLFIAVGLDLDASGRESAVLWIDAVQLERASAATPYRPRAPVEAYLETGVEGHIFSGDAGMAFAARAYNDGDAPRELHGTLVVEDFFERVVLERAVSIALAPRAGGAAAIAGVLPGARGFFRVRWQAGEASQRLRCAVLAPRERGADGAPFGFNHAYPWGFLIDLAHRAGAGWWRDWSAQWNTVEPRKGDFRFEAADAQIERILRRGGEALVLLPFPSASWSTTADAEAVRNAAGRDAYLRARLPVAYAPAKQEDFDAYAAAVVRRYCRAEPRPAAAYQILNEPVYTDYALPRRFGYGVEDYVRLLAGAYRAIKAEQPDCVVVGGIGAGLEAGVTREFVASGGLAFVDVFDVHIYDPPRPAESYEEPFAALEALMQAHGGPKPIWITEWGCYADDDPACIPPTVGDATMGRCRWKTERAATEHIVKFAATAFAHGVRRIFFHAGTCGAINGPDEGGVLFEYGGAPRAMYAGVAAFARFVGEPRACPWARCRDGLAAYAFDTGRGAVAVVWRFGETAPPRPLAPGLRAYDIMGNVLAAAEVALDGTPIYVTAADSAPIAAWLEP